MRLDEFTTLAEGGCVWAVRLQGRSAADSVQHVGGESAANCVQLVGKCNGCLRRNVLWVFVAKCAIDACGEFEMCHRCVADMC